MKNEYIIKAYISVFRPNHWIKNTFILMGVLGAYIANIDFSVKYQILNIFCAFIVTSLAASANYGINEILDCETDMEHPVKRKRALPSGIVSKRSVWIGCGILYLISLMSAYYLLNKLVFYSIIAYLIMGIFYNVKPIRLKDKPYLDVISESLNNPIRLSIGWFTIQDQYLPPISFLLSFWLFGGFLMAGKRYAEYRFINNPVKAEAYRKSFQHYNEKLLLISMIIYSAGFLYLLGVISIKYEISVIIFTPLIMVFLGWYFHLAFEEDSIVKEPERLLSKKLFVAFSISLFILIVIVLYVKPTWLQWLNNEKLVKISELF